MAYNIDEQPIGIAYSRTPILYLVHDDNFTQDSFEYVADVYLWQGLIGDEPTEYEYRLTKPANTSFGNAVFDIKTLTTDWLITPEFNISDDPDKTKEMYVFAKVKFGYKYIDSGGNLIQAFDIIESNIINVYNGYTYYMEGANYVPEPNLGTLEDGYFLTDRPLKQCIPSDTSQYLFLINDPASLVRKVVIETNDGAFSSVLDLDTYTSNLVAVPSGTEQVQRLFMNPDIPLENYKIYGATAGGTQYTLAYEFTVDCIDSCKYGFKSLQFLNRFGVWDYLVCYGAQNTSIDVKRAEILHSPLELIENVQTLGEFYFNKPFGQYHMANVHGRDTLTINTGWIDEAYNEVIKQMMLTQFLYNADTLRPYTLDLPNIRFKTSLNERLINYTLKLKMAYTAVNTVG